MTLYDFTYFHKTNLDKMLIFSAGNGNDAAAALRHGAKEVTAVEIELGICDLGLQNHP